MHDGVVVELAVERMEIVIRCLGTIIFQVAPVQVVVVDEGAIKHDSPMRLERARDHVSRVGVGAPVGGGPRASLGISFDDHACEVGNHAIDLVDLFSPPRRDLGIEWIECLQASDHLGTAQVHGDGQRHSPWTERIRNARQWRNEIVIENFGSSIHIIHGAAIDPHRSQQSRVLTCARKIGANLSSFEKDGSPAIATLDAAVEVVPLIHPSNRGIGLLQIINRCDVFPTRDLPAQGEDAVEHAAIVRRRDDHARRSLEAYCL